MSRPVTVAAILPYLRDFGHAQPGRLDVGMLQLAGHTDGHREVPGPEEQAIDPVGLGNGLEMRQGLGVLDLMADHPLGICGGEIVRQPDPRELGVALLPPSRARRPTGANLV